MTTVDTINDKVADAVASIEAGEYATALNSLYAAKTLLAFLPTRTAKDGKELEFDATQIDSMIATLEKRQGATLGLQSSAVVYERTSE